jgi:hypothetical protein
MKQQINHKTALIVALLVLALSIWVLITAYGYRGGSGIFPRFIGWIFLGLTLTECLVQLKSFIASGLGNLFAFNFSRSSEKVTKEIKGILWIGFVVTVLYLGGFLVGIPLYIFAFLRLASGRSYKQSLLLSVGATGFVYLLFIELLQYRLYQGVFFG